MRRRMPPLNALRAFEAAGRHLSFTKAAAELNVTQAAISHQVKGLEEWLGIKLFRRMNRALLLTDAGQAYLPPVRTALDGLHAATAQLLRQDSRGVLTVSVLPSFAARWLVPRLGRLRERYPDIDVRLAPAHTLVDFARDDVDVGIRYGRGNYAGLRVDYLGTENIFPVCSPALLKGKAPLTHPRDLVHHTLLHDDGHSDWRTWLHTASVGDVVDGRKGPIFTDSSYLVQAAATGQGVALARGALAHDDLEAGRLVRPFDLVLPAEFAYYLVCPEETAEQPKIEAFRAWLLDEVAVSLRQAHDAAPGRPHLPGPPALRA